MEAALVRGGHAVRIIEDCLNGRRTVWDDPFKPGRNGLVGLEQRIEVNSPLALVILMLGTNDFQATHHNDASQSAQGIAALVRAIRRAPIEPGMSCPLIMVVSPPQPGVARGSMQEKFAGAQQRSVGLSEAYRRIAAELDCHWVDAGLVTSVSGVDGVHLDADQHQVLGLELARRVAPLL